MSTGPTGFDAEFAGEIRGLFGSAPRRGLFGNATSAADVAPAPEVAAPSDVAPDEPKLFAPSAVAEPGQTADVKPSIGLFLPRVESASERAAPVLTGLSAVAEKTAEPVAMPNLFVSSVAAPAEVTFVPAEAVERQRYRWWLVLVGLLFVGGAIWLTWMAQSSDTVDAPVTTIEAVPTTLVSTTEAPAATTSTTVSTTEAPATTATTVASTAPATAAPVVRPTTPRRPATTARPATPVPTTSVPTTPATIPDLDLTPPTFFPNTGAGAAPPPAAPVEPVAPPPAAAEG